MEEADLFRLLSVPRSISDVVVLSSNYAVRHSPESTTWLDVVRKNSDDPNVTVILKAGVLDGADPKEVASELVKIEGDFCADVQDSETARKVFGRIGKLFLSKAHTGRLFVTSTELEGDDELVPVAKPFAGFATFDDCVAQQKANGKDDEAARSICGRLQADAEPAKQATAKSEDFSMHVRLLKTEGPDEERFILGVILEPETTDSQGDIYSAEEIRKACHGYMENSRGFKLQHKGEILKADAIVPLENFIAPCDFSVGSEKVLKGTWLLGVRANDDTLWSGAKDGTFNGFSIGGAAHRKPI